MSDKNNTTTLETKELDLKQKSLSELVENTQVTNDDELQKVSDTIKGIKTFEKLVKNEMGKIIDPLKQVISDTKTKYDPYLKACEDAEYQLKKKAGDYMEKKEQERLAAQKKIEDDLATGVIKKPETALKKLEKLPEKQTTATTASSSLSLRKIADMEIIDESLIPDEYWIIDTVKLKKVVVAGVEVPGTRRIEKNSLASK